MRYPFSIFLIIFLLWPAISISLELTYPKIAGIEIELEMKINELVAWGYYFLISIAGLAAFCMLIVGGFQYLTSGGSPIAISEAKDRIFHAILGLILIFCSYLILQIINPELLLLKLPQLPEL